MITHLLTRTSCVSTASCTPVTFLPSPLIESPDARCKTWHRREHGCPGRARIEPRQIAHAPATSSKKKKQLCDRPALYDTIQAFTPNKVGIATVCHRQFIPCKKTGGPWGQGYHHTTMPSRLALPRTHSQQGPSYRPFAHRMLTSPDTARLSFRPRQILEDKDGRSAFS
jgi:hypothetical protein